MSETEIADTKVPQPQSSQSLQFNNIFNSGPNILTKRTLERAQRLANESQFAEKVNFTLENDKELGLYFKITDVLSQISEK